MNKLSWIQSHRPDEHFKYMAWTYVTLTILAYVQLLLISLSSVSYYLPNLLVCYFIFAAQKIKLSEKLLMAVWCGFLMEVLGNLKFGVAISALILASFVGRKIRDYFDPHYKPAMIIYYCLTYLTWWISFYVSFKAIMG